MREIFKSQEGQDPLPSPIIMSIQYWIEIFNTIYVTTIGHMISIGPSLRLTKPVPIVIPISIPLKTNNEKLLINFKKLLMIDFNQKNILNTENTFVYGFCRNR